MADDDATREPAWRDDLVAIRAFFGPRAASWEDRFPDDGPAYATAVGELMPKLGGVVLDAACGTGRALPLLRKAVGPSGRVVGIDITPEMLAEASRRGRCSVAALVLGDAGRLPLPTASIDAILAAGLLPNFRDPVAGLAELARVARPGGRLALFHPIGRAVLASRRGRSAIDDILAGPSIVDLLWRGKWHTETVDDGSDRYLVIATRRTR